jgi:hypothetical protein
VVTGESRGLQSFRGTPGAHALLASRDAADAAISDTSGGGSLAHLARGDCGRGGGPRPTLARGLLGLCGGLLLWAAQPMPLSTPFSAPKAAAKVWVRLSADPPPPPLPPPPLFLFGPL